MCVKIYLSVYKVTVSKTATFLISPFNVKARVSVAGGIGKVTVLQISTCIYSLFL